MNMCVSGYPTLPVKNGPTLTIFFTSGKKSFLVRQVPLPWSEMSPYPGRLLPSFAQDIKHFLSL